MPEIPAKPGIQTPAFRHRAGPRRPTARRAATKAIPQLEAAHDTAQHDWDEHDAPEGRQLERQAAAARRDIAKHTPAANAEHLERLQARATERATSLDRGLSL